MPADPITDAEEYLRSTLAGVTAFRTWVGAADQSEALTRIHTDGLPPPADSQNEEYTAAELAAAIPYALLATDPENGYRMSKAAVNADNSTTWNDSGRLLLELCQFVPAQYARDIKNGEKAWKNTIGQILAGLWDLAGQAGYLAITAISILELWRVDQDEEQALGDQQGATLAVDWGDEV